MTVGPRLLLGVAAVAVAFAAADTYVVVLALPDMMAGAGLSIDQLQRAAPILSGFLLGYVAMLPLVGRVADLRGRVPVLVGSVLVLAAGSLLTAASYDLASMVAGRFLQGVGGGGLVPATLALVADLYPPRRRGVPLGLVGAVQELGSVVGPLYGATVLAVADWRAIFWLNLAVALVLAAALRAAAGPAPPEQSGRRPRPSGGRVLDAALAVLVVGLLLLVLVEPPALARDVTAGLVFVPLAGGSRWATPLAAALVLVAALLVVRCLLATRPLLDLRGWAATARQADLTGATLLAVALGGVVLAFATADPQVAVLAPAGPWLLAAAVVAAGAFVLHQRRAAQPLVPRGSLAHTAARGAVVVSFFVGAALIAALVDIPLFARVTVHSGAQLQAALVLVRFLVALPVGAVLGGFVLRRATPGVVTAAGMACSAAGFVWMSRWGLTSLEEPVATVPLVLTGLGFGLALAPVSAALLAVTSAAVHGVAGALLVVARMVGMLVGVSALTTIGLRRYYAAQADMPSPTEVCGTPTRCAEYTTLLREAGLVQLQTVFLGAACCAAVAGLLALATLRHGSALGAVGDAALP